MFQTLVDTISSSIRPLSSSLPSGIRPASLALDMEELNRVSDEILTLMNARLGKMGEEGRLVECHDYLLMVETDIVSAMQAYSRSQTDLER